MSCPAFIDHYCFFIIPFDGFFSFVFMDIDLKIVIANGLPTTGKKQKF